MQPGGQFRLIVRRGPQPNQQYDLNRDTMTVGRDITNDITINDPEVSRHHAKFVRTTEGYVLEDLRSTNGTFVNRQRLTSPYQLSNGDLIGMGETVTLVYEAVGGSVPPPSYGGRQAAPPPPASSPPPQYAAPPPAAPPPAAPPRAVMPPAPPLYDQYDDDEGVDRNRVIVIGCAVLTILFICSLIGALVLVDTLNLYCDLPLGPTIFQCPTG